MMLFDLNQPLRSDIFTVTQLTRYLRELFDNDPILRDVWLKGEVSNFTIAISGHVYFTLKDEQSSIRCVIWKSAFNREMRTHLQEGSLVELHGYVGIYERNGQYQLYVDSVRSAGEGALFQEFLRLKEKLEAEGLFAQERKRPIPRFPRKLGLVTSPSGAALQDMLNILRNRFPVVEVVLAGAAVQGDAAPLEIVAALEQLNRVEQPDVIILARGGGSLEDLWAFNDERVVRAIVASRSPVISGVGHETDFTLADFAADLRAPTPTAAAVAAVPDAAELMMFLKQRGEELKTKTEKIITTQSAALKNYTFQLERHSPQRYLTQLLQHLDELDGIITNTVSHRLELERSRIVYFSSHLLSLNPYQVLKRGYAIVTNDQGNMVDSIHKINPGQAIMVRLQDGRLRADVNRTEPEGKIN